MDSDELPIKVDETDTHPSLDASLEDFEDNGSFHAPIPLSLPLCPLPSSDQSDFLETTSTVSSRRSDMEDLEPWRPPYAKNMATAYRRAPAFPLGCSLPGIEGADSRPTKRSRTCSPVRTESSISVAFEDDEDVTLQATRRIRSEEQGHEFKASEAVDLLGLGDTGKERLQAQGEQLEKPIEQHGSLLSPSHRRSNL